MFQNLVDIVNILLVNKSGKEHKILFRTINIS